MWLNPPILQPLAVGVGHAEKNRSGSAVDARDGRSRRPRRGRGRGGAPRLAGVHPVFWRILWKHRASMHRSASNLVAIKTPFFQTRNFQNFGKILLVFGCIGTDFCKKICVLQHFSKSTRFSSWNFWNLTNFLEILRHLQFFCWNFTKIAVFSNRFFAKILRLQRCKRMQIL